MVKFKSQWTKDMDDADDAFKCVVALMYLGVSGNACTIIDRALAVICRRRRTREEIVRDLQYIIDQLAIAQSNIQRDRTPEPEPLCGYLNPIKSRRERQREPQGEEPQS